MDKVSIVIPAYITKPNILLLTKQVLEGLLFKTKYIEQCEVILVDDGSEQKNISYLQRVFPQVKVVSNETNQGFAKTVNKGIRTATNDLILLLNNDVQILESGWLLNLVNGMKHLNYDVASVKQSLLDEDFNYIPDAHRHKHSNCAKHMSYLVGWCVLVKRSVFKEVGLFPENFGIGFWEDVAWTNNITLKFPHLKAGVVEHIYPQQILHLEHQTFKSVGINISDQYKKNRETFLEIVAGKQDLLVPRLEE